MEEINFVDDNEIVALENIAGHDVGYTLESSNISRTITPRVSIRVPAREVRELAASYGGLIMLQNYVRVDNKDLAREVGVPDDCLEYWWTEQDIQEALTTSPIEVLLDALDFAPQGIKEQLEQQAVEQEISDNNRLKAIGEALSVDLFSMIKNKHLFDNEDDTNKVAEPRRRRTSQEATGRHRRVAQ